MRNLPGLVLALVITAAAAPFAAAQTPTEEQRDLRSRIEARYEVVPLSDSIALRPKVRSRSLRLIEIESGNIMIDGEAVTGRELRDRVGADADLILRLSYLDDATRKALFGTREETIEPGEAPSTPSEAEQPAPPEAPSHRQRSRGDRVRIMGSVTVGEDERIDGQAVAVLGSVRIDGEVDDQVVAVLGSVNLGPRAVVGGDIVSVGGHVNREPGSQVRGSITEVALGRGMNVDVHPWGGWAPLMFFGPMGGVARLIGTMFHFLILALVAGVALLIARITVERSAERVSAEPVKTTLVGIIAQLLLLPAFVLVAILLAITIVGIPLLLLLPFAALFLVLLAVAGFSGTALTIGRLARRRFGSEGDAPYMDLFAGVLVIMLPLFIARVIGLAGWAVSPLVFLLIAVGLGIEFLAWACGFGSVLVNGFSSWQSRRNPPAAPPPAPPAPESATV